MESVKPKGDDESIVCIGESQGYRGLIVHFGQVFDHVSEKPTPALTTAFKPSAEQLKILNNGGVVTIQLLTRQHPPILVDVDNERNKS